MLHPRACLISSVFPGECLWKHDSAVIMACTLCQYSVVGFGDVYINEPTKYHLVIILQMRKQDPEGIGNMFKTAC